MAAKRRARGSAGPRAVMNKVAVRVASSGPMFPAFAAAAPFAAHPAAVADVILIDDMEVRFSWKESVAGTLLHFTDTLVPGSNMAGQGGTRDLLLNYRTPETALHRLMWGILFESPVTRLKAEARKDGGSWQEVGSAKVPTNRWEDRGDFFQVG